MSSPAPKPSSETSESLFWDGEDNLGTVIFGVGSLDDMLRRAQAAFNGERQEPRINFASAQRFFSIMTPKRWEIVRTMLGAGPLSIREVARRVGRDVKGVHSDVTALLLCGVLDRTKEGKIVFPFNSVRVDFTLEAAA
jgi:predicted transcriptional regulator